jgi:riboflavin kinase/FMN adenylyltransferase
MRDRDRSAGGQSAAITETSAVPVFRSIAEIPAGFGPSVATIGNFDGVHLGHREILRAVVDEARSTNARAVAITFDPHPEQYLRPEQSPRLLTPMPERLRLLAGTGIDAVAVLPFDATLAGLAARDFASTVLADALGVHGLHEGHSFRFGRGAEAGIEQLKELGAELGFGVRVHEAVQVHGLEVSSSAVRAFVAAGDMRRARWMLARPFAVLSTQARGRGIGTAGAYGKPGGLRRIAAGVRGVCDTAEGQRTRISGCDECGQPAYLRRGVLCG